MLDSSLGGLEWRRSSRCNSGSCVEVAQLGELIAVRSSVDPEGVMLTVGRAEWQDFLSRARAGRFDQA